MENLQRFIEIEDSGGIETIWTCCVTCLGHLAALCHFISHAVPSLRGLMDDLCNLALDKLASLSHEVRIEECSYFDALTAVRILARLPRMSEVLTKNNQSDLLEEGTGHDQRLYQIAPPRRKRTTATLERNY